MVKRLLSSISDRQPKDIYYVWNSFIYPRKESIAPGWILW